MQCMSSDFTKTAGMTLYLIQEVAELVDAVAAAPVIPEESSTSVIYTFKNGQARPGGGRARASGWL
jgi:hypothetical protein